MVRISTIDHIGWYNFQDYGDAVADDEPQPLKREQNVFDCGSSPDIRWRRMARRDRMVSAGGGAPSFGGGDPASTIIGAVVLLIVIGVVIWKMAL